MTPGSKREDWTEHNTATVNHLRRGSGSQLHQSEYPTPRRSRKTGAFPSYPASRYVRLKAPPGIGAVQTFSGRRITIAEDRIVEMSEEDADCLIRAGWTKLAE